MMVKISEENPQWINDDYNFLSEYIFLYKGQIFLEKIIATANKITSDEFSKSYTLKQKNLMINHIFVFDARLRHVFNKYIELIEKMIFAFFDNLPCFKPNDKYANIVTVKWQKIDKKKFGSGFELLWESKDKKLALWLKKSIFDYFMSLAAINQNLINMNTFWKNLQKIGDLRNFIYHHNYLFGYILKTKRDAKKQNDDSNSKIMVKRGMVALKSILSDDYTQFLFKRVASTVKKLVVDLNISQIEKEIRHIYFKLLNPIVNIFKLDNTHLDYASIEVEKESNKYNEGWFIDMRKFEKNYSWEYIEMKKAIAALLTNLG